MKNQRKHSTMVVYSKIVNKNNKFIKVKKEINGETNNVTDSSKLDSELKKFMIIKQKEIEIF